MEMNQCAGNLSKGREKRAGGQLGVVPLSSTHQTPPKVANGGPQLIPHSHPGLDIFSKCLAKDIMYNKNTFDDIIHATTCMFKSVPAAE